MKNCCRLKSKKCVSEVNPQPDKNFAKDKKRKDGLTVHCKSCLKKMRDDTKEQRQATIRIWRKNNPEKMIAYRKNSSAKNVERMRKWRGLNRLKSLYNISNDDWQNMFNNQKGCCAICGTHQSKLKRGLCVDHSHKTKKARGLLCNPCNKAIGLFKDRIDVLSMAKSYLEDV